MFERFTDSARRVVVLSQEEARGLLHDYIGTEHILLGLFHARTAQFDQALVDALPETSMSSVREQVTKITPMGTVAPPGHIPFTPRAKRVLEQSLRFATRAGHKSIGAGHLLLAVLDDPESVATRVLAGLGIDVEPLATSVTAAMNSAPQERSADPRADRLDALEEQVRRLAEQVDELRRRLDETGRRDEG
jgi:ATP-dependent Clp protease ATP-binding subunit ClpC